MKPFTLHLGDCIEVMKTLPDNSVDAVVTDPPYGIRFMGKAWDGADIDARASVRRNAPSKDPSSTELGAHNSIAAEAGKYDLAPAAMKAFQEFSQAWATEALRVLKPGGHLLSFSSARTYHRMTAGIEDAGFEIRDQIMWVFGSGFPKSLNVSKAIESGGGRPEDIRRMQMGEEYEASGRGRVNYDHGAASAMNGKSAEWSPTSDEAQQWQGWGTALKPAHEPICVARKPIVGTVASNVLAFGTGAINIEACRVPTDETTVRAESLMTSKGVKGGAYGQSVARPQTGGVTGSESGRWPANIIHDGSAEVIELFPSAPGQQGAVTGQEPTANGFSGAVAYSGMLGRIASCEPRIELDKSAARFFYCAKASRADRNAGTTSSDVPAVATNATMREREDADWGKRNGNHHPTVKPTDLMAYLVRLVTPPGGTVLDPFMGSGSTGKAAMREGFNFIGIEMSPEYMPIATARIQHEHDEVTKAAEQANAPSPQLDLFA